MLCYLFTYFAQAILAPLKTFFFLCNNTRNKNYLQVDSRGTLLKGSLVSGAACMVTAALVPFDALDNIISAGVLLAFNFITSSLLVLRDR